MSDLYNASEDGDWEADVPGHNEPGNSHGKCSLEFVEFRIVQAEALKEAPRPVEEVRAERQVRNDVDDRNEWPTQTVIDVGVDASPAPGVRCRRARTPGEIGKVEDQIEEYDDAAYSHRPAGIVCSDVVTLGGVVHRAGFPIHDGQAERGVHMQRERSNQSDAANPQQDVIWKNRGTDSAQKLSVFVDMVRVLTCRWHGAEVHLQVPDHVTESEEDEENPGDGHGVLLADR